MTARNRPLGRTVRGLGVWLRRVAVDAWMLVSAPVRRVSASRLAVGALRPTEADRDRLASLLGEQATVSVTRVHEPPLGGSDGRDDAGPPPRPVHTAYVTVDVRSGTVALSNNHLVAPGRRVVSESRAGFAHLRVAKERLESPIHLPGSLALLSNAWVENYYHWLCFALPNLRVVLEVLGGPPDHVYVGRPLRPFHLETLAAFGMDASRVLERGATADRVVATFPDRGGAPDRASLAFVRDRLGRSASTRAPRPRPGRRLFIRRGATRHRRLLGADAIERWLVQAHGFELLTMDGRTVAEQVELFADAAIVVAPHGAALTNLLFARPGLEVVELLPHDTDHVEFGYFAELSAFVGAHHVRVRGRGVTGPAMRGTLQDIDTDLDALRTAVDEAVRRSERTIDTAPASLGRKG